jgi:hypothetical protein
MRLILAVLVASLAGSGMARAAPYGPEVPPVVNAPLVQQSAALYRDKYRHGDVPCPAPTHANEVVICGSGRGGSADRLPLPDERGPRNGPRTATGEIPSAVGALADPDSCGPQSCAAGGPANLIAAARKGVQLIHALTDRD